MTPDRKDDGSNQPENLEHLNKSILARIMLINRLTRLWGTDEICDQSTFNLPDTPISIALGSAYNIEAKETQIEEFTYIPDGFEFPVASLVEESFSPVLRVTTRYGPLSSQLVAADNKVYVCNNFYFFDQNGKAVKVEYFANTNDPEEALDDLSDEERLMVSRLDFVPSTEPEEVPINPEDYEKILTHLSGIEKGEYIFDSP